jgi:hypothetical protein
MKSVYTLFISLVLFSCGGRENDYVLSKEQMVPVMVDLYIAAELVSMAKLPMDSASIYFKSIYKPDVLEKYNIESQHFDSSYKYYSTKPKEFVLIQTAVADSLRVKHLLGKVEF